MVARNDQMDQEAGVRKMVAGTTRMDQVAVVTGCSSGFGMLIALELAKADYQVVATMRDLDKSGELLREANRLGVIERIMTMQLDVTDYVATERVVADVLESQGRIDVLVNNAGYAGGGFVEEIPMPTWQAQFDTNVFGLIAMTRAVLPHMRQSRRGRIIQISSISGMIGIPGMSPYNASKFAVEGFSEALRLEMLPHEVFVSVVEPGSYQTAIWQKGLDNIRPVEGSPYTARQDAMKAQVAAIARSAGDPHEVARLVARIARSRRPRFRYPIGRGIRFSLLMKRLLPWSVWEWLLRRTMK